MVSLSDLAAGPADPALPRAQQRGRIKEGGSTRFTFGHPPPGAGRHAIAYLEAALRPFAERSGSRRCAPAPIHKALMAKAGFAYAGHTDYLRDRFGVSRVVMMLAGPRLRVALATVHVPLVEVARNLSRAGLVETLAIIDDALRRDFRIKRPRIAVTGVNPHAGENGLLGSEEQRIIVARRLPRRAGAAGHHCLRPLPG